MGCNVTWDEAETFYPGSSAEFDVLMHKMDPPPIPDDPVLEYEAANYGLYVAIGPMVIWWRPDVGWVRSHMKGSYSYELHGLDYKRTQPAIWEWFNRLPKHPSDRI